MLSLVLIGDSIRTELSKICGAAPLTTTIALLSALNGSKIKELLRILTFPDCFTTKNPLNVTTSLDWIPTVWTT